MSVSQNVFHSLSPLPLKRRSSLMFLPVKGSLPLPNGRNLKRPGCGASLWRKNFSDWALGCKKSLGVASDCSAMHVAVAPCVVGAQPKPLADDRAACAPTANAAMNRYMISNGVPAQVATFGLGHIFQTLHALVRGRRKQ